ncbi:MAG: HRDC domain-containing protein [bacterium]|nr:HRDC domain-containing protein [bacterium]
MTTERDLTAALNEAVKANAYAIDTEFHRERTYYPCLGLLQLAWADRLVLIDPLAVSVAPLVELLAGDGVAVLHAAEQDLEVFMHECNKLPKKIFDTQLAAGFIGYTTPSLATLHERLLGVKLTKQARLSDWLQRPLPPNMVAYAAADVARLLEIQSILTTELMTRGRLGWAQQEFALLSERVHQSRNAADAWLKIKEIRNLQGVHKARAQAVAEWRTQYAARTDQPLRHVLSDLGVASVAQHIPTSLQQLRQLRGVEPRNLRRGAGKELLEQLAALRAADLLPKTSPAAPKLPTQLKPAVSLITSWAAQHATTAELDPALLATRNDIEQLLAGDPNSRAAKGWRAEMIAAPVQQLLAGQVAIAFDPQGKLILEKRSGCPLTPVADTDAAK